jgi:hypothetical protein
MCGVFGCLSVCLVRCHCFVSSCRPLVEGSSLPFYSMQREGSSYNIWMYKNRKKCPKVLPIPSFSLISCIRTVVVVVVVCRDCR